MQPTRFQFELCLFFFLRDSFTAKAGNLMGRMHIFSLALHAAILPFRVRFCSAISNISQLVAGIIFYGINRSSFNFYKCLGLRPERSKQMGSYWVVIIGASALPNPNRFSPFATAVTPSEQLQFGVAHSAFRFPPAG